MNLQLADLSEANLTNAVLFGANLSGSNLTDVKNWVSASWPYAYYYTDNVPVWDSGMDQAWQDYAGIVAIDPTSGDFNYDGVFDAADYTVWQDNLGLSASALNGNGSGAATVVRNDYLEWRYYFYRSTASGSGADHVPEPTTLLLALLALVAAPLRVRCG